MHKEKINVTPKAIAPISRQAATEGIVLLKNEAQVLPIKVNETVSLFGRCQIETYRSGTGSGGAVNVPYAINMLEGLRANPRITINETLVDVYKRWIDENPFDDGGAGWAAEPWFQKEMPLSCESVKQASITSEKAIIFIGRTAGEDQDNADTQGSYRLTTREMDMLNKVCHYFDQVIVVFNVTNIMDMSWLENSEVAQSIKGVLYSWTAGMEGGHALADVLSGDVSPSGKLTDTIAYCLEDYPASKNFGRKDYNLYAEDIYVGYRYFETFAPRAVQYAFGSGLSYTEFKRELVDFSICGEGVDQILGFDIKVENIGVEFSGKEVVQLYVEAPQGRLGKPSRVLAGFIKTDTIRPQKSQIVHVEFSLASLTSYDDSGATGDANCYVLEEGDYQFYLGEDVRQAQKIDALFSLEQRLIVERLSENLAPVRAFDRIKPGTKRNENTYTLEYQAVPQRKTLLADRILNALPKAIEPSGDRGIKLMDVKQGSATLEDFIAQMTPDQLAILVRGEGMCSPKVTPGTAATFGGITQDLFNLGIPAVAAADGPSGIRMDSGHKASQVPIGTMLACTWNTELNEKLFYLIGCEMNAYHIDTLLGPGINIHRHPLNGRNFEYFSEDPLLTANMAIAQLEGLKRAGVSGTIKHFAANDQETARFDVDSVVSQRALREIHLKPFEMAVRSGCASTMMTSYNPINGHWAASNYELNTAILRDEWGYTGLLMTDWWAKMNDPIHAGKEDKAYTSFMLRSQNDLYMVVENDGAQNNIMGDNTLKSLDDGSLTLGELQRSAMNICRFIMHTPAMERPLIPYEPIVSFDAQKIVNSPAVKAIDVPLELNTKGNARLMIEVNRTGVYQCYAHMRYDRNSLAQSSCSLSINGVFAMSLPVNGTDNKLVRVEGLKVKLEQGFYQIELDFVRPGPEITTLNFIQCSD